MKKLILGIAVAVAAVQANAEADHLGDILYWQIPTDGAAADASYCYAQLYASVDGKGNVSLNEGGWAYAPEMATAGLTAEASLAAAGGLIGSFFVEYFSETGVKIGFSDAASFASLVQSGFIGNNQKQPIVPHAGAWQPTFTAVPEPTSGLLMLLGIAGLALRRKKA